VFIATLIAADRLSEEDARRAAQHLLDADCGPDPFVWIDEGQAADIAFRRAPGVARAALEEALPGVDVIVQPAVGREKRLLVADMDSTMITVECIDELADYAGIKAQVAAVTEAAMRGELNFEGALDARVALLKGLDAGAIDRCLAERVRIMPGAVALVRTMRARGAWCVLVSGGFTRFAEPVARTIGFDRAIANALEIEGDVLAGTVARPIVGARTKLDTLEAALAERGLDRSASLAVGDGANDLPMVQAAGLGVAYRAKPIVAAAAAARVDHGDLSALLYAQGIPRAQWVTA
jgi:phosphoserine phosphatase